jgi:hypothetical protein
MPRSKKMKAWLVTWEWMSDSAEVADRIATILPPRMSPERVAEFIEFLYTRTTSNAAELAAIAKHPATNPYRAQMNVVGGVRHSDMLVCGAHPWLYARKVSELQVEMNTEGFETVSWREPNTWRMKPDESGLEVNSEGEPDRTTRRIQGPLSDELIWDRQSDSWATGFQPSADR